MLQVIDKAGFYYITRFEYKMRLTYSIERFVKFNEYLFTFSDPDYVPDEKIFVGKSAVTTIDLKSTTPSAPHIHKETTCLVYHHALVELLALVLCPVCKVPVVWNETR